jgi:hypothetical protein
MNEELLICLEFNEEYIVIILEYFCDLMTCVAWWLHYDRTETCSKYE